MLHQFDASNERLKHRYFTVLRQARGYSEKTIDRAASALLDFEHSTVFAPFSSYGSEQAVAYKESLRTGKGRSGGKPLSAATIRSRLLAIRRFFEWYLEHLPRGVKIRADEVEFLSPSREELNLAKTSVRPKVIPTLEQCRQIGRAHV